MIEKKLGKIEAASFGVGGYQDCMVGLSLTFKMSGSAIGSFDGTWGIKRDPQAKWSEDDRLKTIGAAGLNLFQLLEKIGGRDVSDLVGTPVEVEIEDGRLKSWRILREVL